MTPPRPTRGPAGPVALLALLLLGAPAAARAAAPAPAGCARPRPGPRSSSASSTTRARREARRALRAAGARQTTQGPGGAVVARLGAGGDAATAVRALRGRRPVAWAAPAYRARAAAFTPNDTGQTARTAAAGAWTAEAVGPHRRRSASAPRRRGTLAAQTGDPGGKGITVAVLDTGVAYADRGPYRRSPDLPRHAHHPRLRLRRPRPLSQRRQRPRHVRRRDDRRRGQQRLRHGRRRLPGPDHAGPGPRPVRRGLAPTASPRASATPRAAARGVINVSIELADDRGPISLTAAPDIRAALRYARDRGVDRRRRRRQLGRQRASRPARTPRWSSRSAASTEHGCVGRVLELRPGPRPRRAGRRRRRADQRGPGLPPGRRRRAATSSRSPSASATRRASSSPTTTRGPRWPPRTSRARSR